MVVEAAVVQQIAELECSKRRIVQDLPNTALGPLSRSQGMPSIHLPHTSYNPLHNVINDLLTIIVSSSIIIADMCMFVVTFVSNYMLVNTSFTFVENYMLVVTSFCICWRLCVWWCSACLQLRPLPWA